MVEIDEKGIKKKIQQLLQRRAPKEISNSMLIEVFTFPNLRCNHSPRREVTSGNSGLRNIPSTISEV
jgi:hypothetical protein